MTNPNPFPAQQQGNPFPAQQQGAPAQQGNPFPGQQQAAPGGFPPPAEQAPPAQQGYPAQQAPTGFPPAQQQAAPSDAQFNPNGGNFGQPVQQQAAPAGIGGDPFGTPPPPPEMDGIDESDAKRGTVVVLWFTKVETVQSKYPAEGAGPNDPYPMKDRITFDALVVEGPKAGKHYTDQWRFWERFVGQFKPVVGDGVPYLVKLIKDGNAITTAPVTDPAIRAEAARMMSALPR